ncbi:MAG: T9SS type A sorting domain-containing protein [Ignavibacteria bacterium]|nr:T9SS type A sorting domain-containing protein [Ignavibacteria bacterium]
MGKKHIINSKVFSTLVLIVIILTSSVLLFANPDGYTLRTLKTSTLGCGGCHSQGTTVTGFITTPDSVIVGQSYTFTLTINSTSGSGKYGVDIAAKYGSLYVISGSGLKLQNGELTHSSALTYSSPKIIQFGYIAPTTPGTDTIYATLDRGYTGAWNWAPNKGIRVVSATGIINNETPSNYYLSQNFPNPFNPITKINYGLAKSTFVNISVYNIQGEKVKELINGFQSAGNYFVLFDGSELPSGIYYYKIVTSEFTEIKKLALVK